MPRRTPARAERPREQTFELVDLDAVRPHPDNPRRGDTALIGGSIDANGFYGALVVQRSTGHILAGNHRWAAAKERGLAQVPVLWLDVDDERARRILLADNRTADLAGYDDAGLLTLLNDLALAPEALAGTGYDLDALEDLRAALDAVPTLPEQDSGAHYAETPDEEAERAARRGREPSIHEAGLKELIFVLRLPEHAEAIELLASLRQAAGDGVTSAHVVLAALRLAATGPDALTAHLPARAA